MTTTCGIFIIDSLGKILCVHATGAPLKEWSIPKGKPELGETHLDATIRELKEETNFDLDVTDCTIISLGESKYDMGKNTKKKLIGFVYDNDIRPISTYEHINLRCNSTITRRETLECDKVEWKSIEFCLQHLHYSQVRLLKKHIANSPRLSKIQQDNANVEQLIADVANAIEEYVIPYEPEDYGLTKREWSVREVVTTMLKMGRVKRAFEMVPKIDPKEIVADLTDVDIKNDIELVVSSAYGGMIMQYLKISEVEEFINENNEQIVNRDYFINKK